MRWRQYCVIVLLLSGSFLLGEIIQSKTGGEVKTILTSFFGGVLAVVLVWGGLAKQIFENLTSVASARAERIEELVRELEQERRDRHAEIENERTNRKNEIEQLEKRYQAEISSLKTQLELLQQQYQAAVTEKAALIAAVAQGRTL